MSDFFEKLFDPNIKSWDLEFILTVLAAVLGVVIDIVVRIIRKVFNITPKEKRFNLPFDPLELIIGIAWVVCMIIIHIIL